MSYRIASLDHTPFPDVHACFVRAFSDYAVNVAQMTVSGLLRRARKNGWVPELSFGAFAGDTLAGITLIGVDEVAGEPRAYDIATGIVPAHRGKGLAGRILESILPELITKGVSAFLLEVLQDNQAGIRAYEKAGFSRIRALYSLEATASAISKSTLAAEALPIDADEICRLSKELEFEPSFEQRDFALRALQEELLMFGVFEEKECLGGIAYDTATNWLMRLVTHRGHRRRGIACTLISALGRALPPGTPIRAVNVDENDAATLSVLRKFGFRDSIRQWEMRLELAE